MTHPKLLLVGCGHMGQALLEGWIRGGMPAENITVLQPSIGAAETLGNRFGVEVVASLTALSHENPPETIFFAVKPEVLGRITSRYTEDWLKKHHPLFISIAAGRTISFLEEGLGGNAAIIRAMPNTPAQIGKGVTVLCASAQVSQQQREKAQSLMQAVGATVWLEDETLMDAVTALSGSGPAYIYYFMECLADAGIALGLPAETARQLAVHTVSGAAEVAAAGDDPFSTLREQVTSPGGTTEAALKVLTKDDGFRKLLHTAMERAAERSKELSAS